MQLELGQIEERNQILTKDNAKLLQRWLDAKQAEVNKMNAANQFYEDMQSRKPANTIKKTPSTSNDPGDAQAVTQNSESGNGEGRRTSGSTTTKDGTLSHAEKDVNLTPNG